MFTLPRLCIPLKVLESLHSIKLSMWVHVHVRVLVCVCVRACVWGFWSLASSLILIGIYWDVLHPVLPLVVSGSKWCHPCSNCRSPLRPPALVLGCSEYILCSCTRTQGAQTVCGCFSSLPRHPCRHFISLSVLGGGGTQCLPLCGLSLEKLGHRSPALEFL